MSRKFTQEEFIDKVSKIFPEYDFSRSVYIGSSIKVEVGCRHGYWWSRPSDLYNGHTGCKKCKTEKTQKTNIKKYGSVCSLHCQEVHEKVKKNND